MWHLKNDDVLLNVQSQNNVHALFARKSVKQNEHVSLIEGKH